MGKCSQKIIKALARKLGRLGILSAIRAEEMRKEMGEEIYNNILV